MKRSKLTRVTDSAGDCLCTCLCSSKPTSDSQ
jgi:hypothetical protein